MIEGSATIIYRLQRFCLTSALSIVIVSNSSDLLLYRILLQNVMISICLRYFYRLFLSFDLVSLWISVLNFPKVLIHAIVKVLSVNFAKFSEQLFYQARERMLLYFKVRIIIIYQRSHTKKKKIAINSKFAITTANFGRHQKIYNLQQHVQFKLWE